MRGKSGRALGSTKEVGAPQFVRKSGNAPWIGRPTTFRIDPRQRQSRLCALGIAMPHEHQPSNPAPETGHYAEANVFGTHTGILIHARKGDALPAAPRGFTWRLVERTAERSC